MKKLLIASLLGLGALSAQAADIVDTAASAGSFNTLVTAVKAAGLVDTLKGPGPFTVFAPTDAAFAKIPKAQLDALLKDKTALTKVLTYHVVPGKVMAANVSAGKVKTVQGSELTISTMGGVKVDNANVVKTDIVTDNGVIHVIDTVIMPKTAKAGELPLLIEAKSAGDFTNVNKRRKEEAMKMGLLRSTYGPRVRFILFLCGYFDSGYLGYEAAEGIDWVWEHRIDELAAFGL